MQLCRLEDSKVCAKSSNKGGLRWYNYKSRCVFLGQRFTADFFGFFPPSVMRAIHFQDLVNAAADFLDFSITTINNKADY